MVCRETFEAMCRKTLERDPRSRVVISPALRQGIKEEPGLDDVWRTFQKFYRIIDHELAIDDRLADREMGLVDGKGEIIARMYCEGKL